MMFCVKMISPPTHDVLFGYWVHDGFLDSTKLKVERMMYWLLQDILQDTMFFSI